VVTDPPTLADRRARSTALRSLCLATLGLLSCAPPQPVAPPASTPVAAPAPAPATIAAAEPAPNGPAPLQPEQPDAPDEPVALPWPADCPRLPGARVDEIAGISANVGDSPAGATYISVKGDLQTTFAAWRESATSHGYRVLAEHANDHVRVASLIDRGGARAHILMQDGGDGGLNGMFGRGRNPPVRLRGRCVDPPIRTRSFDVERSAIVHGGEFRRERGIQSHESQLGHDFDDDGELDLLVPTRARAACPRDLMWTVYLSRDGCAHAVGEVGPGELESMSEGPTSGPRPLVFRSQAVALGDGGTVQTTITTTYNFDGKRYVRRDRKQERGTCHHCPVEQCHPPP
jgi:hypothetical protein